jgi:hypothetical protein
MNFELEKKIDKVFMSKKSINPYLNSKDDHLYLQIILKELLWKGTMDI